MSHIEPVIRGARESDADPIAKLHADSWRNSARGVMSDAYLDDQVYEDRRQVWRSRLSEAGSDYLTLVAVQRDGLHGFICFKLGADPQWGTLLDNLHVDPGLCGRGMGESLMRVGVTQIEQLRAGEPLYLLVLAANERAQRFYERLGGRREGMVDMPLPEGGRTAPAVRFVWDAPVTLQPYARDR
ncbi:MAG: GNAT family N-acetyltransferase [Rhodocyclaceae bacterium]|nr:GNAT family N-acetyltransferase [Rhodocyclaceae bacterium]